jgi:hypothetical protein
MAIETAAAVEFFGTQTSLDATSGARAGAAFSVAGDLNAWANTDNAPTASMVLEVTFASAPAANTSVALFARLNSVASATDQLDPSANYQHAYLGSFPVKDVTGAQFVTIPVSLPNNVTAQSYNFFIQNNTAVSMNAGWDLHVTPKTIGPKA